MIMNALFLGGQVIESTFYDQMTGAPKKGHSLVLDVLDADTHEKYQCQLSEGIPALDNLKLMVRQGAPDDVVETAVEEVKASLPPQMSPLTLEIRAIKGKPPFLKLVCRLAQVAVAP
ncbi:hypothetical protein [Ktedonobacter robiniae]|uniref:Uncharacterized protein n=1 Tax=Ktedonobacter robiniae TaxID=2778365 RepID=A0ABQ3UJQ1_9CHLR|nr:hypothetical protein [Ktedonobacter robiniae]GHO52892.1 hypothetical protein KSB_13670 [Ktedonobacter robiniae]